MPTTDDLLGLAIDKNPVDFADSLNSLLMQKAQDRIEQHRIDLAQAIYGDENDNTDDVGEEEFEDIEGVDDDVDVDDTDLDIEDLDIDDLDDIDLEDIDLDEIDDIDLEDLNDEDA